MKLNNNDRRILHRYRAELNALKLDCWQELQGNRISSGAKTILEEFAIKRLQSAIEGIDTMVTMAESFEGES